jgi:hypothetical protein
VHFRFKKKRCRIEEGSMEHATMAAAGIRRERERIDKP